MRGLEHWSEGPSSFWGAQCFPAPQAPLRSVELSGEVLVEFKNSYKAN